MFFGDRGELFCVVDGLIYIDVEAGAIEESWVFVKRVWGKKSELNLTVYVVGIYIYIFGWWRC